MYRSETSVLLNQQQQYGMGRTWFGVDGCGRIWVVRELDRLRCGSATVWDPSEHFVVYHTRLGLPTATPKTLVCAGFHLHLSLLLSCFSVMSKHISFLLTDYYLKYKKVKICV